MADDWGWAEMWDDIWHHPKEFFEGVWGGLTAPVAAVFPATVHDQVTVEVTGQPGHNKQELYYLALSAANGTTRRGRPIQAFNPAFGPVISTIQIEYNAESNWVRCTIMYQYGVTANVADLPILGGGPEFGRRLFYNSMAVYRGPQCDTVGGVMDFVSTNVPGVPSEDMAPQLPWAGRTILTGCPTVRDPAPVPAITQQPVQPLPLVPPPPGPAPTPIPSPNPKPPGDFRSRGLIVGPGSPGDTFGTIQDNCCPKRIDLVALVFASLSDPGSQGDMRWPTPSRTPNGG